MSDPLLPPPPEDASRHRERLAPEVEARIKHLRWLLLLVPFSWPAWMALRRDEPVAAGRLRLELAVCVFNSTLCVLLGCCIVSTVVARQQVIDFLVPIVIESGLVG